MNIKTIISALQLLNPAISLIKSISHKSKDPQESPAPPTVQESKDTQETQVTQEPKESQDVIETSAVQETQESQELQEPKDSIFGAMDFIDNISSVNLLTLTDEKIDNIIDIYDLCKLHNISKEQMAYVFATVYHETAKTFRPLEEYGCGRSRPYGCWNINSKGRKYCYKNGNKDKVYTYEEYPHLYYGRGYVQLTWFDNYKKAGRELYDICVLKSPDGLVLNPSKAKEPAVAAAILVLGMKYGWFTGKKLDTYINNNTQDYINARRIVNGTDRSKDIADIAVKFLHLL